MNCTIEYYLIFYFILFFEYVSELDYYNMIKVSNYDKCIDVWGIYVKQPNHDFKIFTSNFHVMTFLFFCKSLKFFIDNKKTEEMMIIYKKKQN